jgi:murein DD-endopeptidase MepM/ murein hydrolase activator NlpD
MRAGKKGLKVELLSSLIYGGCRVKSKKSLLAFIMLPALAISVLFFDFPAVLKKQPEPPPPPARQAREAAGFFKLEVKPPPVVRLSADATPLGDYFAVRVENLDGDGQIVAVAGYSGRPVRFFYYQDAWQALIPVSYNTKPGDYLLRLHIFRDGWLILEETMPLTVAKKAFTTQYLTVTPSQQAIRTDGRLAEDIKKLTAARSDTSSVPLWQEDFLKPVQGRITTGFGLTRYVNNANPSRHSGLDIGAPAGTPVKAANSGRVTLTGLLHSPGNTVIIDHGLNLFSCYYHLEKILVSEGDLVERGRIIGTVGSTGFSTGPHLHWTMSIGTTAINPWLILEVNPLSLLEAH